jgi:beta-lactamase regulating signal transducer with metallopeptidase domain
MSDFITPALTAIVQVTLVIFILGGLTFVFGRRRPAIAAWMSAATLIIAAGLTVVAFVPTPSDWTWARSSIEVPLPNTPVPAAISRDTAFHGWDVRLLLAQLRPTSDAVSDTDWSWRSTVGIAAASASMLALTHWFVGVVMIGRLRRRSRPILDARLAEIVDECRQALGLAGPVDLRSSAEIGAAATCGVYRPTLILAGDWQSWNESDLRAVVAHELAHIRRRDFAIGLFARFCLGISGYHPLAHWLAARLRFAQELAADQLAAAIAGGRAAYRRSLARMALKQDRCWLPGLAQSFGSNRNTLLGRLSMLQFTDDAKPLTRATRAALLGTIIAIGLSASAVRGPAEPPAASAPTENLPAFELGYLPENVNAFIAMRPSALLSRPDAKPLLDVLSSTLSSVFTSLGLPANAIAIEDIEQIVGPIDLRTHSAEERKKMPNNEGHSITTGINYIRMKNDFDWPALMRAMPKWMSVTDKGNGLFEIRSAILGPEAMTVRVLDKRTIIGSDASDAVAAQRRADLTKRFGPPVLEQVNRAGLAVAIDNTAAKWTDALKERPESAVAVAILDNPTRLALCLNSNEKLTGHLIGDWASPPAHVADGCEKICRIITDAIKAAKPSDDADRRLLEVIGEMVRSAKARQDGTLVQVDFSSSLRWADLPNLFLHHSSATVEVKEEKK